MPIHALEPEVVSKIADGDVVEWSSKKLAKEGSLPRYNRGDPGMVGADAPTHPLQAKAESTGGIKDGFVFRLCLKSRQEANEKALSWL